MGNLPEIKNLVSCILYLVYEKYIVQNMTPTSTDRLPVITITAITTTSNISMIHTLLLGYEPAPCTVHPPPPRTVEGGFMFFV